MITERAKRNEIRPGRARAKPLPGAQTEGTGPDGSTSCAGGCAAALRTPDGGQPPEGKELVPPPLRL
jgi:hypothetical protein